MSMKKSVVALAVAIFRVFGNGRRRCVSYADAVGFSTDDVGSFCIVCVGITRRHVT